MKVNVIGKEYVKGHSKKTGNDFEANVVHVTYKQDGVEGQTCESVWLDCDRMYIVEWRQAKRPNKS